MDHVKQINDRGVLTIPSNIRKHLDLKAGDYVSFKVNDNGVVEISKVQLEIKQVINTNVQTLINK
ncbi:AbrB/MazE/SpoVT family DNA-binding domain-containing protein (plasmid) [Silvanigrella paludirubra]|uniref:AbrB/MazE/SpoVT family DNA-binding domain-containing protein n=1 Tax=Silvanigrella paludirubra TaxID=2499159 RepID=A0A6N6VRE4_9BACT|nr:AbrB/MazE/SpoVT family DNA-binding domain-containing protein [Silvanigrella paludirubra]KAB8035616.1 AbrB/MazE/SpoVT family DNA-binding domain-containing protein [Silvanigrella paludirubra]